MPSIHLKEGWEISENAVTPEDIFMNRRKVIKTGLGIAGAGTIGGLTWNHLNAEKHVYDSSRYKKMKFVKNANFKVKRAMADEAVAGNYNNFYEFSEKKGQVITLSRNMKTRPWKVEVGGLVNKPLTLDIDDILKQFPQEERIYRFRCVEAWSMVVPWIGFKLSDLIKKAEPKAEAKYVRFLTFKDPDMAPNQKTTRYPWPYYEGLTLEEANNKLTLLATGIYGHEMPPQHGAPIRVIVPWKYGFKSIKSIVKIELIDKQPKTFWSDLIPKEYDFWSNVNPKVPHPRWSQASERLLGKLKGSSIDYTRVPTLPYNGYEAQVAHLYKKG